MDLLLGAELGQLDCRPAPKACQTVTWSVFCSFGSIFAGNISVLTLDPVDRAFPMSLECPHCKASIAREGQRFCYRCGQDLRSFYSSMAIDLSAGPEPRASEPRLAGATEVLGSENTMEVKGDSNPAPDSKATLRILLPTGDVFDREVTGTEVQIGKGARNDIVIADPAVSTVHASIKHDGTHYTISDLGSRNGTFVNGDRVTSVTTLSHGDVIGIGLTKLTFRIGGYSETGAIQLSALAPPTNQPAPPPLTEESLAAALVSQNLVSQTEIDRLRLMTGKRLVFTLVEEGLIGDTALAEFLCRLFQMPRIELRTAQVDEEVAIEFPSRLARSHKLFAYGKQSGVLLLAVTDPTDTGAVSQVERELSNPVAVHIATLSEISEQIEKYYGPKLIGVLPSGEKLRFLIHQSEIEIGKAQHNAVVLNDPTVSNTHAVLLMRDGGYSLVDLGSRNGTFVNGERLGPHARTLRHGDSIQVGQTVLTFRNSGETVENVTATLSPAAIEEIRRRAAALESGDGAVAADPGAAPPTDAAIPDAAAAEEDKKKKKRKKKGKDERLKAAYISGLSRIVAQVLGVVLAVLLALYVNSSMRSGSEKPIVETTGKGKAKVKVAKAGEGTEFKGGVFEASGVVQGPGTDGVYFVDDSRPGQILYMPLDQSGQQAGDIKPIDYGGAVADPEAITYGGSFFYVIGSQSHNDVGERNALARFALNPADQTLQGTAEVATNLRDFLLSNVSELQPYADTKGNEGGLNIEGMAWDPSGDRLLLGLRSPIIEGNALLIPLKLKDPRAPFSTDNFSVGSPIKLPLGGLGVRDIQYDARVGAFLLIAGAPTHGEEKNFALWEWNGDESQNPEAAPKEISRLDSRMKPEGITRAKIAGREFLFVVGDGSRYQKIDTSLEP